MSLPSSLSTLVAQPSQPSVFVARLHSTALHAASRNGFLEVVKALVEAGADVKVATGFGKHALDLATKQGHTALVEFLRPLYPEEAAAQLKKKCLVRCADWEAGRRTHKGDRASIKYS